LFFLKKSTWKHKCELCSWSLYKWVQMKQEREQQTGAAAVSPFYHFVWPFEFILVKDRLLQAHPCRDLTFATAVSTFYVHTMVIEYIGTPEFHVRNGTVTQRIYSYMIHSCREWLQHVLIYSTFNITSLTSFTKQACFTNITWTEEARFWRTNFTDYQKYNSKHPLNVANRHDCRREQVDFARRPAVNADPRKSSLYSQWHNSRSKAVVDTRVYKLQFPVASATLQTTTWRTMIASDLQSASVRRTQLVIE
jgi:hypothetical protein